MHTCHAYIFQDTVESQPGLQPRSRKAGYAPDKYCFLKDWKAEDSYS